MSSEILALCPNCASSVEFDDRFCESCGTQLIESVDTAHEEHHDIDLDVAAGTTHRGRVHRRNEDALHLQRVRDAVVAVVCDGVSSSVAADSASRVAADAAGRALFAAFASSTTDIGHAVDTAMHAAQDAVSRVPWQPARDRSAPSCTAVVAVWDGRAVTVCGVGDSRAYWVGATTAERLTVDDSWAQEQVDSGAMTEDEADADRRAHQITRWLGVDAPDEPYIVRRFVPPEPGRLVVCSDGCWNYIASAAAFAEAVRAVDGAAPLAVSRSLVDHALAGGGHDNITVAVVDVLDPPGTAPITGGEQ